MKRLILSSVLLIAALTVEAQQKRLVLVEEFTNTGCGPCASWSPVLDSVLHYRLGDCIAIKYHSGYPDKQDMFYLYDREAHQAKVDFYHVTGVPMTIVDGEEIGERSYVYMNNAISYSQLQPAKAALTLEKELSDHHLTVKASLSPYSQMAGDDVRLFVAVIEEHIEASTPFSNGERELNYTMRKMLTPAQGHQPGAALEPGAHYDWEGSWDIDFFDDLKQLGIVAFLQNMATREILVTAYSGPDAEGQNRLALANLFDTPDEICTPDYYGKVILRNDGANTIESATLNVKVNGSVEQYAWTGHLDYLQRDTMAFAGMVNYKLATEGKNQAEVWFSNINDTQATSNALRRDFSNSVQASYGVRLRIYTDKKPEETTWQLTNSAGAVVRQGGPYTESRKFMVEDLDLHSDDCYQLTFFDSGGDGIKGAAGNGYYQLYQLDAEGKQTRLAQGDYTGATHIVNFNLKDTPRTPKQRLVLFEEFTNTSCDPCAEFSPSLDKTIYERLGQMVPITYHLNFPSNRDPFYLNNPEDAMARAGVYGVTGVPALRVDGTHAGAWGYEQFLGQYIDSELEQEPLADITTTAEISADNQLTVHAQVSNMVVAGSQLRLFAAVVEERIEWDAPADNGERSWNYVMRKMLPSASGQQLPAEQQVTPLDYTFTWPISGFADQQQLGIVTFVQDMQTLQILNAAYTPLPTGSPRAAKILKVMNTPDRICTPDFSSDLMVRNTGSETLTSATLCVSINGQVQQTPWTGELKPLEVASVRTPSFTDFSLTSDKVNDVEIWIGNLNGNPADESPRQHLSLTSAYAATNAVRLTIMTDQKPEETTWALMNSAGDVVSKGGPYSEARKKIVVDLPLDCDDCYQLELEDEGGDGITGSYGRGYFMLHEVAADGKTRLMLQDSYSGALHDVFFSLRNASQSGIADLKTADAEPARGYDLQGRPADGNSHIIIYKDKKIINK